MTCLFCAEQIQNDAILCRFCGAVTENASGKPPVRPSNTGVHPTRKSRVTFRTAGACFLASALFEGLALTAEVPLFGAVRGGASAVSYHLLYVGVFLAMGIGLWGAWPWGYRALVAGTIMCTLDTAVSLLGRHAMEADMVHWLSVYGGMVDTVTQGYLLQMMILLPVLALVSRWGFLLYLYFHRDYFKPDERGHTACRGCCLDTDPACCGAEVRTGEDGAYSRSAVKLLMHGVPRQTDAKDIERVGKK